MSSYLVSHLQYNIGLVFYAIVGRKTTTRELSRVDSKNYT